MSYIRGAYAQASCSLIDELKKSGIAAMVGYTSKERDKTLVAYVREEHVFQVPREWQGFKVDVRVDNELASVSATGEG